MKARSRNIHNRKLQQDSKLEIDEEKLSTGDSASNPSSSQKTTISLNKTAIQLQQFQQNFINEEHQAWPTFTTQPESALGQVKQLPSNQNGSLQPPEMSLNEQNTGFQIIFVKSLPKQNSFSRSIYKVYYQFYHHPQDSITYFFQIWRYNSSINQSYEINYVPHYNNVKGNKTNRYSQQAYAMRTSQAKKTRQVMEAASANLQDDKRKNSKI